MNGNIFLAFGLIVCLSGASAKAEDRRAVQMAAALELAATGIETGDVVPLLVAREMLADLAPSGQVAAGLQAVWDSEARFLARSNPDILARLNAITTRPADPDLYVIELAPSITLPDGLGMTALALPDTVRVSAVTVAGDSVCTPGFASAIWRCDPGLARGTIALEAEAKSRDAHIVMTTGGD